VRTFQQMADEAYAMRTQLLVDQKNPDEAEFPATERELRLMGKRPWREESQTTYGDRIYGLKCVLKPGE
jgi:hypothetical protein